MGNLSQGLVLMVIGMATVFAFLVLMIGAIRGAAAFFEKNAHLFPEEPTDTGKKPVSQGDETAAIAVALAAIRAKRG